MHSNVPIAGFLRGEKKWRDERREGKKRGARLVLRAF